MINMVKKASNLEVVVQEVWVPKTSLHNSLVGEAALVVCSAELVVESEVLVRLVACDDGLV